MPWPHKPVTASTRVKSSRVSTNELLGTKEINLIFVRHGESVHNVLRSKVEKYLEVVPGGNGRDAPLTHKGALEDTKNFGSMFQHAEAREWLAGTVNPAFREFGSGLGDGDLVRRRLPGNVALAASPLSRAYWTLLLGLVDAGIDLGDDVDVSDSVSDGIAEGVNGVPKRHRHGTKDIAILPGLMEFHVSAL